MARAAVYLRFSSDKQRESSLEDQLRNCREFISRRGDTLDEVFIFRDSALSGQTIAGRAGLEALMQTVCKSPSPVDYVVVDDMSRLSRDLGDTFTLFKQLQFDGVEIFGASDGYSSEGKMAKMNLGMRALMNDMFIEDLREKTHRGQKGQALLGRSTGGRLFGYGSVPTSSNEDDGKRRVVHEGEAEIVRKMYVMAAEGKTLQAIVRELVKQGAPSPDPGKRPDRRKGWSVSSARAVLVNLTTGARSSGTRAASRRIRRRVSAATRSVPERNGLFARSLASRS